MFDGFVHCGLELKKGTVYKFKLNIFFCKNIEITFLFQRTTEKIYQHIYLPVIPIYSL
jgi:hypothetical protein